MLSNLADLSKTIGSCSYPSLKFQRVFISLAIQLVSFLPLPIQFINLQL